jgi:small-conductance mechanosensitive channel
MTLPARLGACAAAGLLALLSATPVSAQLPKTAPSQAKSTPTKSSPSPSASDESELPDLKALKEKLAAVQAEIQAAPALASEASSTDADSLQEGPSEETLEVRVLLNRIERAYSRQITSLSSLATEQQNSADLEREETAWKWVGLDGNSSEAGGKLPFQETPPYSVAMVDSLRDSLQSVNQFAKTATVTLSLLTNRKAENANNCKQLETKLRLVSEKLESVKDPKDPAVSGLSAQRDRLLLSLRACQATQEMLALELRLWAAKKSNSDRKTALLNKKVAAAASKMQFSAAELDKITASFATQAKKLKKDIQTISSECRSALNALSEARQSYQNALQAQTSPEAATPEQKAKLAQLKQTLDVRQVQADAASSRAAHLSWLQQLADQELSGWKCRFNALGEDAQKAQESRQKLAIMADKLRLLHNHYQEQAESNSQQLSDLEDDTRNNANASAETLKFAQDKLDAIRLLDDSFKRLLKTLEHSERQLQRWNDELQAGKPKTMDAKTQVAGWVVDLKKALGDLWYREIYTVADPTFTLGNGVRPITLGKFVTALCILLVGYFVCRVIARKFQRFLTSRVHIDNSMAEIIRGWVMFFLGLALVMMVMDYVKIPLTAFAFLGGALALAIGFGTQNLLKNFISGIMLLVEQPLRLGDIVEVGSCRGKVVSIGIRSSVVRNADGIETLIPNSAFLENNVTNWTYSNPQVRFKIRVTVAFSSSSREVSDLLGRVLESHGKIIKEPKPQVLLEEFSDKGMAFAVYYWLEPLKTDSSLVASDLRFMIERQLSEAGILMV